MMRICLVTLVATAALLASAPAWAQVGIPGGPARGYQPPVKRPASEAPQVLPPALPGTLDGFAPAARTNADLSPTDALFDAVNRGDIGSARDAINRGADVNGKNILGMTPLDLSVDLSRNNITFLLLSMRGSISPAPAHPATAAAAGAPPGKLPVAKTAAAAKPAPRPVPKLAAAPRPAPAPAPQQFAGPADPGTPVPQAGFLGFGGSVR